MCAEIKAIDVTPLDHLELLIELSCDSGGCTDGTHAMTRPVERLFMFMDGKRRDDAGLLARTEVWVELSELFLHRGVFTHHGGGSSY